jgi:hypothetical protein
MSALPPITDIRQRIEHVRFVPEADVSLPSLVRHSGHAALLRGNLVVSVDGCKAFSISTTTKQERLVLGAVDRSGLAWV